MIVVALAMLTSACAQSAQTSQPARSQRRLAAAYRPHPTHSAHRSASLRTPIHKHVQPGTRSGSGTNLSAAYSKRTPDEVGREAGLAIRRQLAHGEFVPSRARRVERGRTMRRPRVERATLRSGELRASPTAEPDETATADAAPETGKPASDEAQSMEARRMDASGDAMPAASPSDGNGTEANADVATAAVDRMAPGEAEEENKAAERTVDAAAQNDDPTSATALNGNENAAGSARAKTNDEVASLVMPRAGMSASLRGSLASLERQNDRLDAEGLERIENESDLAARIANKLLVPVPASSALTVNADLEENHRYCRPWTAKFLADLARAHEAAFHRSIEVSSAVRTVEYQKRLMETNGNAAPAEGDLVSPHLTGATVDIAKKGLSRAEMAWMRRRLGGLQAAGKIDVEEEFRQACFHITVYKSYAPAEKPDEATPSKPATRSTRRQTADRGNDRVAQGD